MTYSPPPPLICLIIFLFILFILFQTNKSTENFYNTVSVSDTLIVPQISFTSAVAASKCYIAQTGGDNSTYDIYNLRIASWWGIGFYDSCYSKTNIVFDLRTGNIYTKGNHTCNNITFTNPNSAMSERTCYISQTGFDENGNDYSKFNLSIASWYSIGFPNSGNGTNKITFDVRTGNINTLGKITTNNITFGSSPDGVSSTIIDGASWDTTALCIVGKGTYPNRPIHMWDNVIIDNNLNVSGTITTNNITFPSAVAASKCYIAQTGGDNSTYDIYNLRIASWWGIGFYDSCYSKTNIVFDLRTGNISTLGTITTNRAVCTSSDRRLKQNIKELDSVYDSIKKLTPVTYEWKDDNKNDFGLIAQEYYQIFPFTNKSDLTGEEPVDETGKPKYYTVDYSKLSVILLQGLKETMLKLEETTNKLEETRNILEETRNILEETRNKLYLNKYI